MVLAARARTHFRDGELDSVGVFERGEVEDLVHGCDVFVGRVGGGGSIAGVGVEVTEVLVAERGRVAFLAAGEDVTAFVEHG